MINFFTGENDFELNRALKAINREYTGTAEQFDGVNMSIETLADITSGATLFAANRLIIIKSLSENSEVWEALPKFLERVSSNTELILVEPKPDKRTRTYKDIIKLVTVREFLAWGARDQSKAVDWVMNEAKTQGFSLTSQQARYLVGRTGLYQWELFHALEKLALVDEITNEVIDELVEPTTDDNVFELFETALRADSSKLQQKIENLSRTEDPYRVFGLLNSQILQFTGLILSQKSASEVAKDFGVSPYGVSKLTSYANQKRIADARKIIDYTAEADDDLKLSVAEPWLLIERMLLKIAST